MYILLFLLCNHMLLSMVTLLTFMWLFWSIHYIEDQNIWWICCYLTLITFSNKLQLYSALISSKQLGFGYIGANLRLENYLKIRDCFQGVLFRKQYFLMVPKSLPGLLISARNRYISGCVSWAVWAVLSSPSRGKPLQWRHFWVCSECDRELSGWLADAMVAPKVIEGLGEEVR